MRSAPRPTIEEQQLPTLNRYGLVGSPVDAVFGNAMQAATNTCKSPSAQVYRLSLFVVWLLSLLSFPAWAQSTTEVRAAALKNFPPHYQINSAGNPTGFAVDVLDALSERAGITVQYVIFDTWHDAMGALERKEIDLIPNMGITDDRKQFATFTSPIETFPIGLFVRAETHTIDGTDDLVGRNVSVVERNVGKRLLQQYEGARPIVHTNQDQAFFSLLSGESDAAIYPQNIFLGMARDAGLTDRIRLVGPPLLEIKRAVGIRPDQPKLLAQVDGAVKAFLVTPEYRALFTKWYGQAPPFWTASRVAAVMVGILILAIVALALWRYRTVATLNKKLSTEVDNRKTAEASLQDSHAKLEERVAERTAELETSNLALHESEERYRDIFHNASDLIQSVTPDGSFQYVNPAWLKTLGYTEDDLKTLNAFDVIHADSQTHCRELFERVLVGETVNNIEVTFKTKTGTPIYTEGSAGCRMRDGQPVATRAIFHDVTEHLKAEHKLQQAKEVAESATVTKSRFLAAASHDLRQPLQSIGLYLSALTRILEKPKTKIITGKIQSSVDVMSELLDTLLDISKLDSGSIIPTIKDFNAQSFIDELIIDNKAYAKEKGLELRCEVAPCVLHSDPVLLRRIAENFIGNAIRYTDSGSIEIRCVLRDNCARLEVKDSGMGIPKESLDTIFEEYFQLDNPVRDRRKGLGLGLSIAKHIAHLLEHDLDVYSEPGVGSTFAVLVPLGDQSLSELEVQVLADSKQAFRPSVLFVDDDPAIVDAMTELFELEDVDLHTALNGDEALEHLKNGVRPDLLVSDFRLPNYDGVEVIQRVRKATNSELPSVIMTGDTSSSVIENAKLPNCTVFHKPINFEHFLKLIEDHSK